MCSPPTTKVEGLRTHKNVMKVKCNLIGVDGNMLTIVSKVYKTLKENNQKEKAEEMKTRVFEASSYSDALGIISEYVEIF